MRDRRKGFGGLASVPNGELVDAFLACYSAIKSELNSGIGYPDLAAKISVDEGSLKQFKRRGDEAFVGRDTPPKDLTLRRGSVFARIYSHYFLDESLDPPKKGSDRPKGRAASPSLGGIGIGDLMSFFAGMNGPIERRESILLSYVMIAKMLGSSGQEAERSLAKVEGRHFCYRIGSNPEFLVRSFLEIQREHIKGCPPIWSYRQRHYDSNDQIKDCDGIAVSMRGTIYLIGDVHGMGVELVTITEPLSGNFKFATGFINTINQRAQPLISRIAIKPADCIVKIDEVTDALLMRATGIVTAAEIEDEFERRVVEHLAVDGSLAKALLLPNENGLQAHYARDLADISDSI